MNEIILNEDIRIENLIYEIRGKQVMLDSDLARLYKCVNGTKTINQAVKRHINRFPERFMFRLSEEEALNCSRSQSGTLKGRGYNIKYLPYVFTEQGVAMLATVLKTDVAEEISIKIMDAFVSMRKYISNNLIEQKYINELVLYFKTYNELLTTPYGINCKTPFMSLNAISTSYTTYWHLGRLGILYLNMLYILDEKQKNKTQRRIIVS